MKQVPEAALEEFRNNGFYVLEIPPYRNSYAVVPKDELDDPDDFDLNNMKKYNGFAIEPL